MGILVYTLVSVFLWPRTTEGELYKDSRQIVAVQRGLFETYRDLMTGKGSGVDSRSQRMQEMHLLARVKRDVMEMLTKNGVDQIMGRDHFHNQVVDVVQLIKNDIDLKGETQNG